MNRLHLVTTLSLFLASTPSKPPAAQTRNFRVFISADMEGTAGVVDMSQVAADGRDYETSRALMIGEVNAAIQGAFDAGATEVVVNDSHGTHTNLLPEALDRRAILIRGRPKPQGMVEGLDSTFQAVLFIGYHARASTANAVLEHTYSLNVKRIRLNGVELGETGMSATVAGYYGVPVVFISGDQAVAREAKALLPGIDTVVVKWAVGRTAARNLHPAVARERIRAGVAAALRSHQDRRPLQTTVPVTVELQFENPGLADIVGAIPGVERVDALDVRGTAPTALKAYQLSRLMTDLVRGAR